MNVVYSMDYWEGFHRALDLVEREVDTWVMAQREPSGDVKLDAAIFGLTLKQYTTTVRGTADEWPEDL